MSSLLRLLLAVAVLGAVITLAPGLATMPGPNARGAAAVAGFGDLSGEWRLLLDRTDSGVKIELFKAPFRGPSIKLPGTLQAQGFGDEISEKTPWVATLYDRYWYLRDDYKAYTAAGKVKVPFLSQPPRHYLGVAWYQREIQVPQYLQNRRLLLTL